MDLFSQNTDREKETFEKPLFEKIRPQDFEGLYLSEKSKSQLGFIKPGSDLNISFILYGPPGVGKTSIMHLISLKTNHQKKWLNAVDISVKDLRAFCKEAKEQLLIYGKKTLVFIDEIHRLSKAQQDVLLPSIESGEVVLVGATTETPQVSLNRPLVSRCRIIKLEPLGQNFLTEITKKVALELKFDSLESFIDQDALEHLMSFSQGDARKLIGLLESLHSLEISKPIKSKDLSVINLSERGLSLSREQFRVENTSALIKSMRGSDLEASLFYMLRLVEGGVDPIYIYRRFIVFASEDIGNADPQALILVQQAKIGFEAIGMPEGYYGLAQVTSYLARAPKSRESMAFLSKTKKVVWDSMNLSPPDHLLIRGSGSKKGQNLPKGFLYGFLD